MQAPVHLAIDAELKSGRLYGIVGPSPAETLELLCALTDVSRVTSGRLMVNGQNAGELDPDALRSRIALVTWPPLLFEGTLSANLRIAKPDATDEELEEVLGRVAFEDDLKQLAPVGGLETPLECQGVHLSVGQQQRLALARALLREPDVLLLDDPFRGLDQESTQRSLESLREFSRRRLVVLVAPGEVAMRVCDELLVVVGGRVVAQTTFGEATRDPEIFKHLFPGRQAA
jgi:ABC-type multidrug transport system fused ATPase/permease subunit